MNAFRISEDCTFVSKELVLQHVSASTVNNGISIYKKGDSKNWAIIELQNGEFLQWETLSKLVRQKVGDIEDVLTAALFADSESDAHDPVNDIELILDLAFTQSRIYGRYFHTYQDRYYYSHEVHIYAKMHSFIDSVILLKQGGGYALKDIHKAICGLARKRTFYNFKVGSFEYFKDKINLLAKGGVDSYVIHGNKHRPKEYNIKLTSFVKKQLVKFYVQNSPRRLSYPEITEAVNVEILKFGYASIHLSTTKKYLGLPDIQNRFKPFRLGKEWAKKHLDPFLVRAHPLYIHDKWEIDGTVLPFYVLVNNRITRLWLCIVVDVHSRKIIGYGIDYHETSNLVFNTYRMAIVNCRCLPFEIVRDNAKAFDSKLICEL
ncbi:MAG TPA: transposase family protein, partial [Cyclobacteriaceae bacterium]|nr:transposase family protein [Cyclobacteriaceae bacterium]